ncbi:Asp-tRNA(Asn)/Glu-tRNA(Gln) amidotransferase subunit GatA [Clostridium cochlearium]|jgi:aspartyl-tRNA(Asn)/glutamyl-tRNA(Gln) amidotransferase subunit A|uniref:Glutamyl-tRNA(Gln) amidotransferase subunit A n=1 Tax=Clostridium cochlearium TaxID=1494 RepID=A0A7Y3V7K8_CLOCO|nr:Asp-tRNA(Asn)/Glu-tRNA(Gln) amidotransferase subunit GatA [Clostridium cochlearium]MBE6065236.1 Asp-tRNA(Asn)/Glu-tRNA(Gln) amidotransferase subunit GatA [Clostridium cochlearium]NME95742.1 Asp-tRNA(Asn)/Glu-tRNA(Gln) amidotransferase subunit GatA [Clostridium cochlearium]NOH15302.1 Asp-tRNA(Asn)/Glu-tRNA(Gln) amidotransferase subunit GatA [Clostridium cochlearium]
MELYNLTAHELKSKIDEKEVKVEEVVESYLNRIEEVDSKVGAFLYTGSEEAIKKAKELDNKIAKGENLKALGGIPVSIKDNISVKDMQNTCASKMLQGYKSPYDAHVIEKIKNEDGIILGKVNMDEFAMGSSTENSAYKLTRNPWDLERVPGGSSGGSAAAVAAMETPLALGTDTGGSVRQPAAFCGLVGLKPTYGRISRYGAIAFGSTLDQVGILSKDVEDCALLTKNIAGLDHKDFTTADIKVPDYTQFLNKDLKGKKIGIPRECFGEGLDENVRKAIKEALQVLKENGAEIEEFSLPSLDYALAAYYIISSAEASSNLARFDGIRYGYRTKDYTDAVDIYFKSRNEGFGKEAKRRIMLGTYVLSEGYYDAYYKKALKVRNVIKREYENVFKKYHAIISPTSPTPAFKIGEKINDIMAMYLIDIYTVPVSVAGLPAMSIPCGMVDGLPIGLQIIGNYYKEDDIFNIAYSYEQSTQWHKMKPQL